MIKWGGIACTGIGIAFIAYKVLIRPHNRLQGFESAKYNVDIEGMLDDDVLDGLRSNEEKKALVDSDDELNSDTGNKESSPYEKRAKGLITAKESEKLKGLAKKIRANKENLVTDDHSSKLMLKSWLQQDTPLENRTIQTMNSKSRAQCRDSLFYNLFASYMETATHNKY